MGLFCCYDIINAMTGDDDLNQSGTYRTQRNSRNQPRSRYTNRQSAMSNAFSIKEDALLEDMCELADIEYEGDPTKMSRNDKSKMLKRLSKAPQTEGYFKSERALTQFYENKHLNLPGTESQRKTHIGVIPQSRFSGIDSRLSTGTRAHSHLNPVQSRLSAMRGQNASKHSRMSATQRSRISNARSVKHASSSSVALAKNGGNPSSATSVSASEVPQMKRASKSYALASDIINNINQEPERSTPRISVKMPKLFSNSIIADQRNSKFTSQSDGGKITQPINTLDDLKIKRGSSRHKRSTSSTSVRSKR